MSGTEQSDYLARINETLDWIDPCRRTIAVGGTAVSAQLAEAGLACEPSPDVDVLGPPEYFDKLMNTAPFLRGAAAFRMRRWRGWAGTAQASNFSIDVYPDSESRLPFTVCAEMNGVFPVVYESVDANPDMTAEASGIRAMALGEVLRWKAMVGRPKDLASVRDTLPLVADARLVHPNDVECIEIWLGIRMAQPDAARNTFLGIPRRRAANHRVD